MIDSNPSARYWSFILLVILVFGLGAIIYSWIWGFSALSGALYLSLPNEKGESTLYRYQLEHSISYPVVSLKSREGIIIDATVQPSSSLLAFVTSNRKRTESHIYIRDSGTKNISKISSDSTFKDDLSWSADSALLAYTSPNPSSNNATFPESQRVFVSDISHSAYVITAGTNPIFTADNQLILIKDDGLYLFDTGLNSTGRKIWDMKGGKANASMSLAISRDGKLLAWSNPLESKVFIFRIKDIKNVELIPGKVIPARAHNIVFSPDGKYLALHELVPAVLDKDLVPHASLTVYNLFSVNKKVLISSLPMPPVQASLNDWVAR